MANNEKKKSTIVHDTICLFVITLISGILLGGAYIITKEPIDTQNEKLKQEAYEEVYQGASFEENKDVSKKLASFQKDLTAGKISSDSMGSLSDVELLEVMEAKVDGTQAGYVLTCTGKGYGGAVKIALGIDDQNNIKGIKIMDCSNETPGLGQNAGNAEWNKQYIGMNASKDLNVVKDATGSTENGTINSITGATITSSAVTRAVDAAFQFITSLAE